MDSFLSWVFLTSMMFPGRPLSNVIITSVSCQCHGTSQDSFLMNPEGLLPMHVQCVYERAIFFPEGGGSNFLQKKSCRANLLKKISCKLQGRGAMEKIEQVMSTNPVLCLVFFSVCWSLHSNVLTSKQCELWPLPWFDPLCQWPRFGNPFISRSHTFSPEMPQRYLL